MKMHEAFPGNYLTKDDVEDGLEVCIDRVEIEDLHAPDGITQTKPVLYFHDAKPLVLNKENWQTIADLYGDESDDWAGHWIEVYVDPSVRFGGKRVGGIRVKPETPAGKVAT